MTKKQNSHVLIVEDDHDVRSALKFVLEQEGYTIFAAENGRMALEHLKTHSRPCLILLDLMMPVMDGWTLKKMLESDPDLNSIPVIIMSAARAESAQNLKSVAFLSKPLDLDELLNLVGSVC